MVCIAIKQANILLLSSVTLQVKAKKNLILPKRGLRFLHKILSHDRSVTLLIPHCDATIACSERRFLAGIVCPKTIPPRSQRVIHLVGSGTLTMAAFVQLRGTGPAGPRSPGHAAQQTCACCQSAHLEVAVAMWRANAAKAICVSKQNYQFEAKSEDRWRGRSSSLAAALAAAAASTAASDTIPLDSHS